MKSAVQAGAILGVMVVVWTLLHGMTGWYKDPGMSWTFWMVVPFQVILLVWMLKNTKKQGFGYGQQVMAGVVMSLVAGAIIFAGTWLVTTMVFPTYYADVQAMMDKVRAANGKPPGTGAPMSAMGSSMAAFLGTVCTGLVVSVIAAVLIRDKTPRTIATAPA
jgi:hypothetical protein